jgi:hypothetical protein
MKNKFYILAASMFAFFGSINAQVAPTTGDLIALPTTPCPSPGGTLFTPPSPYTPTSAVQLGVNNTGTDVCTIYGSQKPFQVMTWDNVTAVSPLTSTVYVSFNFMDIPLNSVSFPGGYDPDVAIWSDSSGTYVEIVFENNATGKIDGYTYVYNGSIFVPYTSFPFQCTLSNDATKKAKNPNVTATKDAGRFAVVWHEEGLVTPPQTLTVTYSTTPPVSFTNTVSLLQSKVYIYMIDKPMGYMSDLLGSPTSSIVNKVGIEVVRNTPPGTNNLFDRNFNPDVSMSEEIYPGSTPSQVITSIVFLSEHFNPATFSIVSDGLSVVQGVMDDFRYSAPGVATYTHNFTRSYSGKPRIASRLNSTVSAPRDFSVVMGNANTAVTCTTSTLTSKLHSWWYQTGSGAITCPSGGVDLLTLSPFYATGVTSVDPVISCINNKGHYAVAFATNANSTNRYDIVANTYTQGTLLGAGAFSIVNYGTCSATQSGNQVIPSIASVRKSGSGTTLADNTYNNYLFWDQISKTLNFKKTTNNKVPGAGVSLREALDEPTSKDDQTKFIAVPNPTDSQIVFDFKLDANETPTEIEIFNSIGQSVDKFAVEADTAQQKRDVSKMPAGTYIAILKTNGQSHKLQFIRK